MKYLVLAILTVCSTSTDAQIASTDRYNISHEFLKAPNFAIGSINPQLIFFPPKIKLTKKEYQDAHVIDSICKTVDLYIPSAIKQNCRYIYLTVKSGLRDQTFYFNLSPIISTLQTNAQRQIAAHLYLIFLIHRF